MADRKLDTINLSGNQYAKVADRLKAFREDWPKSKIETVHSEGADNVIEFTTYIWKDKTDLLDIMKAGVTDKEVIRSSADANGTARGEFGKKQKDFEKLESVSLGRALAMIGYLGSGEIASFEEMESYLEDKAAREHDLIQQALDAIAGASTNDELDNVITTIPNIAKYPEIIKAGRAKRAELAEKKDV